MATASVVLVAVTTAAVAVAAAAATDPLVEEKAGVVVDWRRGTIEVTGGAAADHRMPSAEVARPGAERRARTAARARLSEALR
ncbi:MAG: hypothetical protein H7X95_12660, partial [Deltaproteobacteria bacterium]|nr:hypothetical protein [Deltaproteobacteria bacterium]